MTPKWIVSVCLSSAIVLGILTPSSASGSLQVLVLLPIPANQLYAPTGVTFGAGGTLYGASPGGSAECGLDRCGIVYGVRKVGSAWTLTTVYQFHGADGQFPSSPVLIGARGRIYGTTAGGGSARCQCGVVYELTPTSSGYIDRVVYSFKGKPDGATPYGSLVSDAAGAIYGVTLDGGTGTCFDNPRGECGTVFKLTPERNGYVESVVHDFQGGASDGKFPVSPLVLGRQGQIFGVTQGGGAYQQENCALCSGVAFELVPGSGGYTEQILHSFGSRTDGGGPGTGLLRTTDGALYGGTWFGGNDDCGVIFRLVPEGKNVSESVAFSFDQNDGCMPESLIADESGAIFGDSFYRSSSNGGLIFEMTPASGHLHESILYRFRPGGSKGFDPRGRLIIDQRSDGLFGTTNAGPDNSYGEVFRLSP